MLHSTEEITILFIAFYFFSFYFNWRLITLQYCGGFCHTFTWISHGCTCVPHPDPPSLLPPHPISQGHPSAPALSTLSHALNLDWRSVSHMIIYMFQCYSLKSSHPRLLPQSPKDCSIHLCLFCCLVYRDFIFLKTDLTISLPSMRYFITSFADDSEFTFFFSLLKALVTFSGPSLQLTALHLMTMCYICSNIFPTPHPSRSSDASPMKHSEILPSFR